MHEAISFLDSYVKLIALKRSECVKTILVSHSLQEIRGSPLVFDFGETTIQMKPFHDQQPFHSILVLQRILHACQKLNF